MLKTLVKNWTIISLFDQEDSPHMFLWGIVVNDELKRFKTDDYVCTSKLLAISPSNKEVITKSNNKYVLQGSGTKISASLQELELMRAGFSPDEIRFK